MRGGEVVEMSRSNGRAIRECEGSGSKEVKGIDRISRVNNGRAEEVTGNKVGGWRK